MEESALSTDRQPVRKTIALAALLAISAPAAQAVGFGDMFNPGRWFGGDEDNYYNDGPWGAYGPGPYGAPGYAPYGGYGYGPYGAPGYPAPAPGNPYGTPGYAAPAASPTGESASGESDSAKDREIEALKQRIEQLESRNAPPSRPQPPPGQVPDEGWPSAPTFRPMDQY
jgi:hypothetical protein